ncbi:hypothetical protein MIMGU_mgv1a023876mg [Erythranthe guttata]|uniref:Uncharacterized protein n=1 Tax=Erythranthe guttata TaxID=4155 RepID=A0A022Q620_ERYGU|nr:hypothetical protein MIMGU_mgv1a023876mg [Erythranthe guttata]
MSEKTKKELVVIPSPGRGHLQATLKMANLLVDRSDQRLSITLLVMDPFHHDPNPTQLVRGFGTGPTVLAGFVVDMFCTGMIDVANEFRVATYMRDYPNGEYNINHDEIVQILSYKIPVPTKLLPSVMFEKNALYLDHASRFREMKGILVNTFSGLECHAIESLSRGIMVPPIYPIGPILDYGGDDHDDDGDRKWLDKQPISSVVFVCFGSKGYFDENQGVVGIGVGGGVDDFVHEVGAGDAVEAAGEEGVGDELLLHFLGGAGVVAGGVVVGLVVRCGRHLDSVVEEVVAAEFAVQVVV